jgi:hypothetical protein
MFRACEAIQLIRIVADQSVSQGTDTLNHEWTGMECGYLEYSLPIVQPEFLPRGWEDRKSALQTCV